MLARGQAQGCHGVTSQDGTLHDYTQFSSTQSRWVCCKTSGRKAMDVKPHLLFSLGSHSKQFYVTVAERIPQIPPYTQQDDLCLKMTPFEGGCSPIVNPLSLFSLHVSRSTFFLQHNPFNNPTRINPQVQFPWLPSLPSLLERP